MIEIRRATIRDAETLSVLNVDVQQIHADAFPHLFKRPTSKTFSLSFMKERLLDPHNFFFIVQVDDEDIGYVSAHIIDQPENPFMNARNYIYIDQISIKTAYRGKGYGEKLLEEVRNLAKDQGIKTISLDVWSFNEKARAFFVSQGFVTFNERMWIREEK